MTTRPPTQAEGSSPDATPAHDLPAGRDPVAAAGSARDSRPDAAPAPAPAAPQADVARALALLPATLYRRRGLMLLVFLVLALAAVAGAYLKRQEFESTARLLVKVEQRNISLSQADLMTDQAARSTEEAVATQAEMLSSIENVAQVVQRLGPGVLEAPLPKSAFGRALRAIVGALTGAIDQLLVGAGLVPSVTPDVAAAEYIAKNLRISPVRRTQIVEVAFRARTPDAAHAVLSELMRLHLAKQAQLHALSESYEFYRRQADDLAASLRVAEDALGQFKHRHALIDAPAEKTMLMQKVERMTSMLEGSLPSLTAGAAPLPVNLAGAGEPAMGRGLITPLGDTRARLAGNELSQMMARLNELRLERVRRAGLFEPGTPLLDEVDNQVRSLERTLDDEVRQIRKLVGAYQARLRLVDSLETELFQLQRTVVTRAENHRTYAKAAEDRRIAEQAQARGVAVVFDAPSQPVRPLPPSRLVVLLAGLVVAMLAALACGVLAESLALRRRR